MARKRRSQRQPYDNLPSTHAAFRPYALLIGQIVIEWNILHENLALSYCIVMGGGYVNQFLATWHALTADRAQRDVLLAAMAQDLNRSEHPWFYAELKWICDRAQALEDDRNNIIHAPLWAFESKQVMPETGLGHIRAKKLADRDLKTNFRWVRDSAAILSDYARDINRVLERHAQSAALPQRPSLPIRPATSGAKPGRQSRPAKRPTPPRSSRA
jgi:hypothetical protein